MIGWSRGAHQAALARGGRVLPRVTRGRGAAAPGAFAPGALAAFAVPVALANPAAFAVPVAFAPAAFVVPIAFVAFAVPVAFAAPEPPRAARRGARAPGFGGPPGTFIPTSIVSGSGTSAPQRRQIAVSPLRATGPASTSWTAPTGSRDVVKLHFG
jgi:hypothetical protein